MVINWAAVAAIATCALAAIAFRYLLLLDKAWHAIAEAARAARDAADLNGVIYESTHRPFIAVTVELLSDDPASRQVEIRCSVRNSGLDQARDIEVEIYSGLEMFQGLFRFGSLQPTESRTIRRHLELDAPLARQWQSELEDGIKFDFERRFSTAQRTWAEMSDLYVNPDPIVCRVLDYAAKSVTLKQSGK